MRFLRKTVSKKTLNAVSKPTIIEKQICQKILVISQNEALNVRGRVFYSQLLNVAIERGLDVLNELLKWSQVDDTKSRVAQDPASNKRQI